MQRASRAKFHYIYVTTCKVTGRYYIGMHSTNNLDDGYIGSGKRLWSSIKKYGAEQHVCEILEFCSSRAELRKREAEHVNEERLRVDPFCMNLAIGGDGGWEHVNKTWTKEKRHDHNCKAYAKAREKWAKDPRRNAVQSENGRRMAEVVNAKVKNGERPVPFKGETHTEETKAKISLSQKGGPGRPHPQREETKQKIRKTLIAKGIQPPHGPLSEETKQKIRQTLQSRNKLARVVELVDTGDFQETVFEA